MSSHDTVPGMSDKHGAEVAAMLQKQLSRYNDLHLTSSTCIGTSSAPTSSRYTR
jgi:hypothetical protein